MEGYVRFTTVSLRPKNNDENICFYTETVCDETSIKIINFLLDKQGYLIHPWLFKGLKGTIVNKTWTILSYFKLQQQSL